MFPKYRTSKSKEFRGFRIGDLVQFEELASGLEKVSGGYKHTDNDSSSWINVRLGSTGVVLKFVTSGKSINYKTVVVLHESGEVLRLSTPGITKV